MINTKLKKDINSVIRTRFGLETEVWPILFRLLFSIASMRQTVRALLFSGSVHDKACKQRLLTACDRMRDEDLVRAGIRLQDRAGTSDMMRSVNSAPAIGLVAPEILAEEILAKAKVSKRGRSSSHIASFIISRYAMCFVMYFAKSESIVKVIIKAKSRLI